MTQEEREARVAEITARLSELNTMYLDRAMPDAERDEWRELQAEKKEHEEVIAELVERRAVVESFSNQDGGREAGATFQASRPGVTRGDDIWDLSTIRTSLDSPEGAVHELRDRALRATERFKFPPICDADATRDRIDRLVDDREDGSIAKHILATGSPLYHRAFAKWITERHLTPDEQRAMNITTATDGGAAVPVTLDPTVILVSNWSVNPMRAISRVVTVTGNVWQGLTSTGMSATYAAEAAETTDGSPVFVQPEINVERAQALAVFSRELEDDWSMLGSEIAQMLADAKDDLEADKFINGAGHASHEPQGLVIGATTQVISTSQANTFTLADLYAVQAALPPRFRPRATWVANQSIYQIIRRFSESATNNSVVLVDNLRGATSADQVPSPGNVGYTLLGKPAYESSAMDSFPATTITADIDIMVYGDFRHYVIVDRIGMSVELVPHMLGANRLPTNQRGLVAYWRNSAEVIAANAFRVLHVENTS
jgi:HK97 family phage major capsid protein